MARTDERRAASMFHPRQEIAPGLMLTPAELAAHLAPTDARREREDGSRRPAVEPNEPHLPMCEREADTERTRIYGRLTERDAAERDRAMLERYTDLTPEDDRRRSRSR